MPPGKAVVIGLSRWVHYRGQGFDFICVWLCVCLCVCVCVCVDHQDGRKTLENQVKRLEIVERKECKLKEDIQSKAQQMQQMSEKIQVTGRSLLITGHHRTSQDITGHHRTSQDITRHHRTSQDITGHHRTSHRLVNTSIHSNIQNICPGRQIQLHIAAVPSSLSDKRHAAPGAFDFSTI